MAAVTKYGFPQNINGGAVVGVGVVGHKCLSVVMFCAAHCICFGREVHRFDAGERHGRGRHVVARAKGHGEGFGAGLQVHGRRSGEVKCVAHLDKRCCQHVVVQRIDVAVLREDGSAHCILLGGIEHGVGIDCRLGLYGYRAVAHGDGLVDVIDRHDREFSLLCGHGDVALVQAALAGVGASIGVGIAGNGDGAAFGQVDGIVVRSEDNFRKGPAASQVFGSVVLPETERQARVGADSLVPVQIEVAAAAGGDGLDFKLVAGVVVYQEVSIVGAGVRHVYEAFAVAIAGGRGVRQPLLGVVAVDVVHVGLAADGIKGEETVIVLARRRMGQVIGVSAVAVHHRVQVFGSAVAGLRGGTDHRVGLHLPHGADQQGEKRE